MSNGAERFRDFAAALFDKDPPKPAAKRRDGRRNLREAVIAFFGGPRFAGTDKASWTASGAGYSGLATLAVRGRLIRGMGERHGPNGSTTTESRASATEFG